MRSVTVAELISRLESILDIENDTHVSSAEKLRAINAGYTKFWDFLVNAGYSDYFVKSVNVTTTGSAITLATAISAGDFYKLRGMYVEEGQNRWRPIPSVPEWNAQSYGPATAGVVLRLDYIPCAPVLLSNSSIDGINGWEDLIICYAALEIARKRQEEPGYIRDKMKEMEERITKMAPRDAWYPDKVIQRRKDANAWFNANRVDGYRLRASGLEFFVKQPYI